MRLAKMALVLAVLTSACQAPLRLPPAPGTATPPADTLAVMPAPMPVVPDTTQPEGLPEFEDFPVAIAVFARFGVIAPFSGRFAAYGKSYLDGTQLALESFRGVDTRGIEVVPADSKGDAISGLKAARRLIERDDVLVILGGVLNLPTLLAAVEANCHGVPLLSNVASEDGIGDVGPYVFHQVASRTREAGAAADLTIFQLRRSRAALLYPDDSAARNLASGFSERISGLGGQVVASEVYAPGTKDFTAIVRRLRRADPEVLYLPIGVDDMLLIAPTLGFQGLDAQLIGTEDWQSDRLLRGTGVDLDGALVPSGEFEASRGDLELFQRMHLERHGHEGNQFAAAGFVATNRLLEVLMRDPQADRERLREALQARFDTADENQVSVRFMIVRDGQALPFASP